MLHYKGRVAAVADGWMVGQHVLSTGMAGYIPFPQVWHRGREQHKGWRHWHHDHFAAELRIQISSDLRASWICRSRTLLWGWVRKPIPQELASAGFDAPAPPCRVGTYYWTKLGFASLCAARPTYWCRVVAKRSTVFYTAVAKQEEQAVHAQKT